MKMLLMEPDQYWEQQFQSQCGDHFEIITVRDTASAEDILRSESPDVVVGELLLADGPSYQFLERTRRMKNNLGLPIIIFSKINTLPDIEAALGLGVMGYFVKGQDTINDVRNLLLTVNQI